MAVRRGRGARALKSHRSGLVLQEDIDEAQRKLARKSKHAGNWGALGGILAAVATSGASLWLTALASSAGTAAGHAYGSRSKSEFDDIEKELEGKTYYGRGSAAKEIGGDIEDASDDISGGWAEAGAVAGLGSLALGGISKAWKAAGAAKEAAQSGLQVAEYAKDLSIESINDIIKNNATEIVLEAGGQEFPLQKMIESGQITDIKELLELTPIEDLDTLKGMIVESAIDPATQRLVSTAEAWKNPFVSDTPVVPGEYQFAAKQPDGTWSHGGVQPPDFSSSTVSDILDLNNAASLRLDYLNRPGWTQLAETLKTPTDFGGTITQGIGGAVSEKLYEKYKVK